MREAPGGREGGLLGYGESEGRLKPLFVVSASATSTRSVGLDVSLRAEHIRRWPLRMLLLSKRLIDIVGSTLLLVLSSPLLAFIAWRIAHDSSGPMLFSQTRVGAGERQFRIYKFRTMTADAESRLDDVKHLNIHAAAFGDNRLFKGVGDPRITPFGARLRRYSLDELPQLLNVLKGEMSNHRALAGPRSQRALLRRHAPPRPRVRLPVAFSR